MSAIVPAGDKDEQSEQERLEIARRYREQRRGELAELVAPLLPRRPTAVGEFSTLPLESLAAIPLVGAFFAFVARARQSRKRITPNVLLALDPDEAHLLAIDSELRGPTARLIWSRPRDTVRVAAVEPRFIRDEVVLEAGDDDPLTLYAARLRTNPWAAEVVRELGGDAPEPIDLGSGEEAGR